MIKAIIQSSPTAIPILLLGLSGENITRLIAGEPIMFNTEQLAQLGFHELEVIILYGRTEDAIIDELESRGVTLKGVRT
jgi:hypothetical protein